MLFSAERSDATILFDLALLPPREGGGQVSELHMVMSNPTLVSLHLKWLSFETSGRLKCVSNGLMLEFLMLRTRPVVSFPIYVSVR